MAAFDVFGHVVIPLGDWVEASLNAVVSDYRWFFQGLKAPFEFVLSGLEGALRGAPDVLVLAAMILVGLQFGGRIVATVVACCMIAIGLLGIWHEAMTTLAIVLTSVIFCCAVGIPLGVAAALSDRLWFALRPVLDTMQTIPSFVYLIPVVMLFSIGNVAGVIVTSIYALAPVVRLTNLGLRQVRGDLTEAAYAFGANKVQTLTKIQFPLALPTIMAGVNQTVMLALSMSVVSSMIAVTGLGQLVLRGIGGLNMGLATVGGLGIVFLAVVVDRITQSFGASARDRGHKRWFQTGPVGLARSFFISGVSRDE